jgi:calcineurin-like phosphoesterase family protein
MSTIFFISDLHLGHKNIISFEKLKRPFSCIDEHDQWLIDSWNSVVSKRDCVYVLGDVASNEKCLSKIGLMKGSKHLILGNHDKLNLSFYLKHFDRIRPCFKHKKYWLSHIPIHPGSLRNIKNIHGHIHSKRVMIDNSIVDKNYINVCVEALNGVPISLDQVNSSCK